GVAGLRAERALGALAVETVLRAAVGMRGARVAGRLAYGVQRNAVARSGLGRRAAVGAAALRRARARLVVGRALPGSAHAAVADERAALRWNGTRGAWEA